MRSMSTWQHQAKFTNTIFSRQSCGQPHSYKDSETSHTKEGPTCFVTSKDPVGKSIHQEAYVCKYC